MSGIPVIMMKSSSRPDAIARAQLPPSARRNPATPIIIAILSVIGFFLVLLLFLGYIPYEAVMGAKEESKNMDAAVHQEEERAMKNLNQSGSLYPNESQIPAKPDPILSKLEKPFSTEENKAEK